MPHCQLEPAAYVGRLAEAARSLAPHFAAGEKLTRRISNSAMEAATSSTSASGTWSQRDSFQMLEMAVLRWLAEQLLPSSAEQALACLSDLESRLPTQTVRSEEQIEHQHFSTPLGLAWLAAHLAAIQPDDTVLEPSAGTGMLAIWARHAASLQLNEIDPIRQEILRHQFSAAQVTGFDAARIGAHLAQRPSVVLMNPPFARNAAGLEDPTTAARHLAAALGVLKPNGRLVAVMPDSFQPQGRRAELFHRALHGATVALHARLEGAFAKQGTSIAVRLLVVDKCAGAICTTIINRSNLVDLIPFLSKVPSRRRVSAELPLVATPPAQLSNSTSPLLGGFRSATPKAAPATPCGDANGAKALQRLLTTSFSGKALAVKRVTENQGKRTPGVDRIIWNSPGKKVRGISSLKRRGYRPQPLRRVFIPKANGKLRPLGIPTMIDRARQALHLLALLPIAETTADPNSYGFRPYRGARDAIGRCFLALKGKGTAEWVLDADISGCFDNISHDWLITNIPMDKVILRKWLTSGYMQDGELRETRAGTPQGGIISPTLANMTLDGMEAVLQRHFGHKYRYRNPDPKVFLVRYADDFVITGSSLEVLEIAKALIVDFLAERGLSLSAENTRVVRVEEGFDFLG